jgi:hypothetical protein
LFEHDRVDAGPMQQLSEQQSRWARTDDGDLYAHLVPQFSLWRVSAAVR